MTEAFLSKSMNRFGDCVYRLALCRLQNVADAEDAFQDTFLSFFQQDDAANWDDEHLRAWLLRVAINKCCDIARKRKHLSPVELADIPEIADTDRYGYIELWDAVNRLPEKQRLVFHLHYAEGLKTEEIAQILKMPGTTVRVMLSRARNTLRKELQDDAKIQ